MVPAPRIEVVDGGVEAAQKVFDRLKKGVEREEIGRAGALKRKPFLHHL